MAHGTSAASSAKASSASGSRSIAISVPAEPDGAVDDDLPRLRVQGLDQLPGEDGDVRAWHVKQDGQEMR